MRKLREIQADPHILSIKRVEENGMDKSSVYFGRIKLNGFLGTVMFGYDENGLMEHVSISSYNGRKLPTWEQMAELKDIFFYPEEMAVQIHPAADRYIHGVGSLGNVLHLWRPMDGNWEILNHPERWD